MQPNSKTIGKAIGGVLGLVTIISALFACLEYIQNRQASDANEAASATDHANQAILILLSKTENALGIERATNEAEAKEFTLVEQTVTPISTNNVDYSLTAIPQAYRLDQIEATKQAITNMLQQVEATQTAIALLQPTSTPVFIADIKIYASDVDGESWCASDNKNYYIVYSSGAYSGWPDYRQSECESAGCWITTIRAYINREIEWVSDGNITGPENADIEFNTYSKHTTSDDAEERARLLAPKKLALQKGDCITFVATDAKLSYVDNPGYVVLKIGYLYP